MEETQLDRMEGCLLRIEALLAKKGRGHDAPPPAELSAFMDKYNSVFGTKKHGNAKTGRQLSARLKEGYTLQNMESAMKEAKKEKHHADAGFKWLTPEFFTRSDKLDMYMKEEEKKIVRFKTYEDLTEQ